MRPRPGSGRKRAKLARAAEFPGIYGRWELGRELAKTRAALEIADKQTRLLELLSESAYVE